MTDIEETDNSLDMSWVNNYERVLETQHNFVKEPMKHIQIHYVYINVNDYIEKINSEQYPLEPYGEHNNCIIKNDTLLKIIQDKKITTQYSRYKLIDIMLYNVDIDPENIHNYSKNENITDYNFMKKLSVIGDIIITPSIFIFHEINTLYFFFKEVEFDIQKVPVKPILKSLENVAKHKSNRLSKKVKINVNTGNRFTKKNLEE